MTVTCRMSARMQIMMMMDLIVVIGFVRPPL